MDMSSQALVNLADFSTPFPTMYDFFLLLSAGNYIGRKMNK